MTKKFSYIANIIGWAAIILWGLLSLVVLFFINERHTHPNIKGMSNHDLKDYLITSIWLIGIFVLTRVIRYYSNIERRKQKS